MKNLIRILWNVYLGLDKGHFITGTKDNPIIITIDGEVTVEVGGLFFFSYSSANTHVKFVGKNGGTIKFGDQVDTQSLFYVVNEDDNGAANINANITLEDLTIDGNNTSSCFVVYQGYWKGKVASGTFTLNNGTIVKNFNSRTGMIRYDEKSDDSKIIINDGVEITNNSVTNLYDIITSAVPVEMNGGRIHDNTLKINGSIVHIIKATENTDSYFLMTGGSIDHNSREIDDSHYNEFYAVKTENDRQIEIGGSSKIVDNTYVKYGMTQQSDVYLSSTQLIKLRPDFNGTIGITTKTPDASTGSRQITENWDTTLQKDLADKNVIADNSDLSIVYENNHLSISNHVHSWKYIQLNDYEVKLKCTSSKNKCKYNTNSDYSSVLPRFLVLANDVTYPNSIAPSYLDEISPITGDSVSDVTYVGRDGTEYNSTTAPSDAGKYTIKATIKDYTVFYDFEIKKGNPLKEVPTPNDAPFDDTEHELVKAGTLYSGTGTLLYSLDGIHWSEDIPKAKNKGEYTVKYKVETTDKNYESVEGEVIATIGVALIRDVQEHSYSDIYDGKEHKATVTTSLEGATISYKKTTDESYSTKEISFKDAGNYKVDYKIEKDNYKTVTGTLDVNIAKRDVKVVIKDISKEYQDKDPSYQYSIDNLVEGDNLSVSFKRENGENVGTYPVDVKDFQNPNYNITDVTKGKLTITPLAIDKGNVILGKVLKYTGAKQTQEVEQVVVNGKVLNKEDYEVLNNQATDEGKHVLTIKAKEGNCTGSFEYTYAILPKENSKIGSGTLTVKTTGNVKVSKDDLMDVLIENNHLTANELSEIAEGKEIEFILDVKDSTNTITKESKELIKANTKGYTVGKYLDITLYKIIDKTNENIHELSKKLKVTISIPEELLNKDSKIKREYAIVRNHNGKVEILEGSYDNESHTYTFETDRFSDYAIIYKDVNTETKNDSTPNNQETVKPTVEETKATVKAENKTEAKKVKTGDDSHSIFFMGLIGVSLLGIYCLIMKKFIH